MSMQDSSHNKTTCSRSATQCWQSITCYIIISTSMYLHLSDDEYTEAPVSMYFNTKHCVPLRITPKQKGKSVSCSCSFRIGSIVQSGYIDHMHTSPHLCNVLSQDRFCQSWSELDCPVRGGGLVGSYVCCHHTCLTRPWLSYWTIIDLEWANLFWGLHEYWVTFVITAL